MGAIMLVDDDAVLLGCLADLLGRRQHKVFARSKAEEALAEIAAGASVDLVITDYAMAGMDGIEFLHALKHLRPGIPAIVLTGHGTLDRYAKAKSLGAVGFFQKPVKIRDLLSTIDSALSAA